MLLSRVGITTTQITIYFCTNGRDGQMLISFDKSTPLRATPLQKGGRRCGKQRSDQRLTNSTRPKPPTPRVSIMQKSFSRIVPSSCGMAGKLRQEKRAGNVVG